MKNTMLIFIIVWTVIACGKERSSKGPIFEMGNYSMFGVGDPDQCIGQRIYGGTWTFEYEGGTYKLGDLEGHANHNKVWFNDTQGEEYEVDGNTYEWGCDLALWVAPYKDQDIENMIEGEHTIQCFDTIIENFECVSIIHWMGTKLPD